MSFSEIKDKLFDLIPGWIFRLCSYVKARPRYIKWWFERANGKVPSCDSWNSDVAICENIVQHLDYHINYRMDCLKCFNNQDHKERIDNLLKIRSALSEYTDCHNHESYQKNDKALKEAFTLLGKEIPMMWD